MTARKRTGWPGVRASAILSAIAILGAACSPPGASVASSVSPIITDGTPSAALLYVTGDPAVASRGLTLIMTRGGSEAIEVLAVAPGERIIGQAAAMPGDYTVTDAEGTCSLAVTLAEGREIDVVIQAPGSGSCRLGMAGDHPAGEGPHPWFGALVATLAGPPVPDASIEVLSLDTPPNPVPSPVAADPDDGSRFFVDSLPAGRYQARVTSRGTLIGTQAFEIGTGPTASATIEIQPQPSREAP